jgi:OOP family OmpA-OmpF porin
MKRVLIAAVATGAIALSGCSTKKSVRAELTPTVNKVNELDELTAKNTNAIKDVDTRTQQGISGVNERTTAADQKAQAAGQTASQAQTLASQAAGRVDALANQVVNLDNYRPVTEADVHFAFDSAELSRKAKAALDELAAEVPNTKGYIISLTGATDSVGDKAYNYELSERRASAVTQYLASKHNIPAHKVYVIGLGEDKSVASNTNAKGRAENRRVEVRLMTNVTGDNNQVSMNGRQPQSQQPQ